MLLPTTKARVAPLGRRAFWRDTSRRAAHAFVPSQLAASPFRRAALALLITFLGYVLAPRGARSIGVFVAFLVYSIADPAINAFRPHWWINAGKSLIGFVALLVAAIVIGEVDHVGEAGMVFILPMMAYPFALGISGLIRFLWFYLPRA